MMPETHSVLENLQYILNKGHPLQQPYVILYITHQAYRNFHIYPNELLESVCAKLSKE